MDKSDYINNFFPEEILVGQSYYRFKAKKDYNMDQGLCFESVPVNSLKIICWVPCRIKQYNNIGTNKIKTQSTSPKNEKQEQ